LEALHILPLMAFSPIFWMLYDQQGSVWTLQATRLNLHGFEPKQLNVLNPLEIMIFIPLFDLKICPWLERRGFNIQPAVWRIKYGMFLAAVSFLMSTWLEHGMQSQPPLTVSVTWQIPQITVLTVAEILLNVTGLEFAYTARLPRICKLSFWPCTYS
jgi:dipeptide/tripeptide permease